MADTSLPITHGFGASQPRRSWACCDPIQRTGRRKSARLFEENRRIGRRPQTLFKRPVQPRTTALMNNKKLCLLAVAAAFSLLTTEAGFAQKKYDTGASDSEIKMRNIMPYSGPASSYGLIGKIEEAYFKMSDGQG